MKKKAIFVIGPEGSGSTLIAQIISNDLNGLAEWNGSGFNCCNSATCDKNNNFTIPCREVDHIVCHRSLPFLSNATWPPIDQWKSLYDVYFVICTRDTTISKMSVIRRFQRKLDVISAHQNQAKRIIKEIIKSDSKHFIWSYETFMYLQEDYLRQLRNSLGIKKDEFSDILKDANSKYLIRSLTRYNSTISRIILKIKRHFN